MGYRVIQRGASVRVIYDRYESGKRVTKWLTKDETELLGFRKQWDLAEHRYWARQLTEQERQSSYERRRQAVALKQHSESKAIALKVYGPYWGDFSNYWKKRIESKRAQVQLNALTKLLPEIHGAAPSFEEWGLNGKVIYDILVKHRYSLDYAQRLIKVLNEWGSFYARRLGKTYVPIKPPKGSHKERIRDAQRDQASKPLTPELLKQHADKFSKEQLLWIELTVWFGLRPGEVSKEYLSVQVISDRQCLVVYQKKLASLPKDRRYKVIPVLFPEQAKCLEALQSVTPDRPLSKTTKKYLGCTLYGGRKNFVELMQQRGRKLLEISSWMGHTSVDRTRKIYTKTLKLIIDE